MEIKRRLNRIAGRITPQIEVMNVADEMRRMCNRFEEILNYAEEKVTRAAERKETVGALVDRQKKEKKAAIEEMQRAESEENMRDQQEAAAERQAIMDKSKKNPRKGMELERVEVEVGDQFGDGDGINYRGELADGTVMADPEVSVPKGQVGVTDAQLNPGKKKAKKKAKRKAKKKKA